MVLGQPIFAKWLWWTLNPTKIPLNLPQLYNLQIPFRLVASLSPWFSFFRPARLSYNNPTATVPLLVGTQYVTNNLTGIMKLFVLFIFLSPLISALAPLMSPELKTKHVANPPFEQCEAAMNCDNHHRVLDSVFRHIINQPWCINYIQHHDYINQSDYHDL